LGCHQPGRPAFKNRGGGDRAALGRTARHLALAIRLRDRWHRAAPPQVASGRSCGLGTTVNTRQRLFEPGAGWRAIDNTLAAGDYQAVGLDVSGISIQEATALKTQLEATKAQLDSQQFAGLSKHDLTGAILQAGIVGYFAQTWGKGQIMARTANVLLYRLPSVGTLSTASSVSFWFGVPRRFIPSGVAFDVDRNALSSAAKDDDRARWIAFNRSYNQILSAHEHSVLEDMFSTPTRPVLGVSTVKAIAVAAQQGQRIYTITQANLSTALSQISLPADVETDIANAVNAGFQVTTHQADIQYAGLVTAGYAIEDPNTGVGAMLISSGESGGKILTAIGIILTFVAFVVPFFGATILTVFLLNLLIASINIALFFMELDCYGDAGTAFTALFFLLLVIGLIPGGASAVTKGSFEGGSIRTLIVNLSALGIVSQVAPGLCKTGLGTAP